MSSYHGLYITTEEIQRTSIFNLPFNLAIICTRTAGWELRDMKADKAIAGEYSDCWLVLDVDGHIILDSRKPVPA